MRPIGVGSVPRARMIGLQITSRGSTRLLEESRYRPLAYSDLDDRCSSNVRFARIDYRRARRGRYPFPNGGTVDRWINAALCVVSILGIMASGLTVTRPTNFDEEEQEGRKGCVCFVDRSTVLKKKRKKKKNRGGRRRGKK